MEMQFINLLLIDYSAPTNEPLKVSPSEVLWEISTFIDKTD